MSSIIPKALEPFSFWQIIFLGQSIATWLVAIALICVFVVAFYLLRCFAKRTIRPKLEAKMEDARTSRLTSLLISLVAEIQPITILLFSAYLATAILVMPPRLEKFLDRMIVVIFLIQIGIWGNKVILFWLESLGQARAGQALGERSALFGILRFLSRFAMWSVLAMIGLNNLGVDITALIAGLSVGGLAVGFALQNILADLFASLTIALDKPFAVGDAIQVDNENGVVENIGLKTTRVRSVSGEQVIFSNTDLLKSRIHNFKRLNERRAVIRFGVAYSVAPEQLKRIPDMVKTIVMSHVPQIRFDHVNLMALGESDLKFELVYIVLDSNFIHFLEIQQAILNEIYELFARERIAFAQPTRSIEIHGVGGTLSKS